MPLTRLSYLLDVEFFGMEPTGFRITSLALHLLNTVLVFSIATFLFKHTWQRILLTSLVAFHPQHVEAVVWIAQRKELLAASFGLTSILLYLKSCHATSRETGHGKPGIDASFLLALLFFVLSLLSKPTWVLMPVLLVLVDYFYLGNDRPAKLFQSLARHSAFFVISFCYTVLHLYATAANKGHVVTSAGTLELSRRIINAPVVIVEYLVKGLFPFPLAGYQPYPLEAFSTGKVIISILVISLLLFLASRYRRKNSLVLIGVCWFLVSLLPVIGIIGIGESIFIGDRWTYLPHIGLFIAIISSLSLLRLDNGAGWQYLRAGVTLYLCFLFVISILVSRHWQNGGTYWAWTLTTTNNNHYAHYKAGEFFERKGDRERAEHHYTQAHDINPSEYLYALRLGNFYFSRDNDIAVSFFHKLLDSAPSPAPSTFKMGIVFLVHHQYDNAKLFFHRNIEQERALPALSVDYFLSNLYLYHLLVMEDKREEAGKHLAIVISEIPGKPGAACDFIHKELAKIETLTRFSSKTVALDVHCGNKSS